MSLRATNPGAGLDPSGGPPLQPSTGLPANPVEVLNIPASQTGDVRQIVQSGTVLGGTDVTGSPYAPYILLTGIAGSAPPHNSIFVDTANSNALSFKNNSGTVLTFTTST